MGDVALYSSAVWWQREGEGEKLPPPLAPAYLQQSRELTTQNLESRRAVPAPHLLQHSEWDLHRAGHDVRGWGGVEQVRQLVMNRRSGPDPGLLQHSEEKTLHLTRAALLW